ncbi:MmgE/PrpD family protein [Ramlibacter sp.]|uniref:MmgE/PrpD family protein n=1 Tax=Ramlibacter sp. TaxID=1917967 RepID=UPI003D0E8547
MALVHSIAREIAALRLAAVPADALAHVKSSLLYTACMTVAGYEDADPTALAARTVAGGEGAASLFVNGARRRASDAAFANGAVSCSRGQNDTHPQAIGHAGCIVVPAVLAVAQERGSSGEQILEALTVGYELLPKLAGDVAELAVARGLRATSVFGPVIAAGAVAKLIGLDEARIAHALALGTQFSAGTMQCWTEGTPEWRLQVGHSAQAGVQAALLAEAGAVAAAESFEGKAGWYAAFFGRVPELHWGDWALKDTVFKPYPGCMINQAAIYMLRRMMDANGFAGADVESVVVGMNPREARYPGIDQHGPYTQATGAVMSLAFMVATMLRDGTVTAAHFRERYGEHPVHAEGRKVRLVERDDLAPWACDLRVTLKDGRAFDDVFRDQSSFALGWDDTRRLLQALTGEWPLPDAASRFERLAECVKTFEREGSADALLALCTR